MYTWFGQILADTDRVTEFGEKTSTPSKEVLGSKFESILEMLLSAQYIIGSVTPPQIEKIGSECFSISKANSPAGNHTAGNHMIVQSREGISVRRFDGDSMGVGGTDQASQRIINEMPQVMHERLAARLAGVEGILDSQINEVLDAKAKVVTGANSEIDIAYLTSSVGDGATKSGEGSQVHGIDTEMTVQQALTKGSFTAKEVAFLLDLGLEPNSVKSTKVGTPLGSQLSSSEQTLLDAISEQSPTPVSKIGSETFLSVGNNAVRVDSLITDSTVQSSAVSQEDGILVAVSPNSGANALPKNLSAIFIDSQAIGDSERLKIQSGLNNGASTAKVDRVTGVPPEFVKDFAIKPRLGIGNRALSIADLFRSQLPADENPTVDVKVDDVKANIDSMWRMDSSVMRTQGSQSASKIDLLSVSGKPVFVGDRIEFNSINQRGLDIRAECPTNSALAVDSQDTESTGIDGRLGFPIQLTISNRKGDQKTTAAFTDSFNGLSKAFDKSTSLKENPGLAAGCHRIFDKVIDEIQKGIPEKHQVSLKISTDDGKRIYVDISLISNQVRARVSVSDIDLRDVLASHGWLLVQRFEANGLIAQQVEFSLFGEERFGESRRERKWAGGQSSVDDLEEAVGEFETVAFSPTGFDRFA
ncbi:MAG: hypothetical protein ACUVQ7_06685 [bacterium]